MKVVLLEDIKTLGKKGDVCEVSDGYGRNFLLARKKAVEATPANLNTLKLQKANADKLAAEALAAAQELCAKVEGTPIELKIKAGEGGKVFGSISGKEIAQALSDKGIEIDKKKIVLPDAIKKFGDFEVPIKLHKDVTAKLKVKVSEE